MHSLVYTNVCHTPHTLEACSGACKSMQGVFLAPDGINTAMQLFSRQVAHLRMAMCESCVYQAHLCSFFALLGAMPHCLKAEADAIMLMIRTARETTEHPAAEAEPSTGDPTAVFISSASLSGANWTQLSDVMLVDVDCAFKVFLITQYVPAHVRCLNTLSTRRLLMHQV